ncbi:hypothetical protein HDV62DRAFT_402587 [Trichoderma sp. SZMC 28011]
MTILNFLRVVGVMASLATSTTLCQDCDFVLCHKSQENATRNYIDTWNGDFSLENITFTPNVNLYQDRLPGFNGSIELPIGTSGEFIKFMKMAHTGWNHYQFVVHNVAFDKYNVVIRWALNATVGPHDKMIIPINKPEGSHITYNGTDWLYLDDCTGRIKRVDSAQDYITALHAQGLTEVKV